MSYQIYDANDGSWIKVREPSGLFGYVWNPKEADVFARHDDAERALARFHAQLGPTGARFKIRPAEGQAPSAASALFVGGPLDGQRRATDEGRQFFAVVPTTPIAAWMSSANLEDIMPIAYARYDRLWVGSGNERHLIYVFAGLPGKGPSSGEFIRFRGQDYRIKRTMQLGGVVEAQWKNADSNRTISVEVKSLRFVWATALWFPEDGARVELFELHQLTAP